MLADPLWYAAGYGSFTTGEDKFSPVSKATLPDAKADAEGYFLRVTRPNWKVACARPLTRSGRRQLHLAVSSAQLVSDSIKYVAEFDAKAHTGVKAYKLVDGAFKKDPEFELGDKLTQASRADTPQRQVITNVGLVGMPLTKDALAADTPVALGPFAPHWMPMRRQVVGKNWSTMRAAAWPLVTCAIN